MNERLLSGFTLFAALAAGTVGGVFFAFSSFVMAALARLPAPQGIAAMQSINVAVINPVFMAAFMGTALASLILGIAAVMGWSTPGSAYLLAGAALYLVGTFGVTMAFHVPRNDALAALNPTDPASAEIWKGYVQSWTFGNHVRTAAALAASAMFVVAFRLKG